MGLIKILKNQKAPAADIILKNAGVTIPASGTYTINPEEYPFWTTIDVITEITPLINSGDIVVNDGFVDLAAAPGIRYLEKVETTDISQAGTLITKSPVEIDFIGSNVEVLDAGNGVVTVEPKIEGAINNDIDTLQFGRNGNVSQNSWLLNLNNIPSNTSPTILAYSSIFRQISWSNENNAAAFVIELYSAPETNPNARTLFYTETVSGRAGHTGIDQNIAIAEGQGISVRVASVGNPKPSSLVVTLWMRQG